MYLQTTRVLLRDIDEKDEDNLYELDSDPEVMRYLTHGTPSSRAEVQTAIQRCISLRAKHNNRFGVWAAVEKNSGRFMGWFLFRPCWKDPDNTNRIELGYRLKQAFWGRGYATEVSKALITKGFAELGVTEVFAVTMKTNLGSQAVMRKAGLVFVREFENPNEPDSDTPEVEYAIVRGK